MHWCRRRVRFNEVPEKVPKVLEKVWEALVQSQVTFAGVPEKVLEKVWVRLQRVPEKVPEKVPGSLGAKPSQVQQGSGEGSRVSREGSGESSGEGLGGLFREALVHRPGSTGFAGNLIHGNPAEVFPALGFAARFRKICKNKTLRLLLGIPPKLIIFTKDPALPTYVQF